jgi:ammonia channel protein AmtB
VKSSGVARLHTSTLNHTKAFTIAIHIPVLLWVVTGYVIASQIAKSAGTYKAAVTSPVTGDTNSQAQTHRGFEHAALIYVFGYISRLTCVISIKYIHSHKLIEESAFID